ncbi:DUF5333 domain-containing protein [Seohaeicola saemankumensis]|nr:DUF5333 domain-containing protein [Seohaeicola saemankumensis]MCA0870198.1 DUF5333 domain-containing protein [Seohaeicola saemankumensis]
MISIKSVIRPIGLGIAVTIGLSAGAVSAKSPLRDVAKVDDALLYIAIANEIDERCDSIAGRRLKAIRLLWDLKDHANDLGYSDAEIRSFVESDSEKARMRKRGEAYLAANGASYDKPETFCALGRAEIARNSAIGVLLRAK